MIKKLKKRSEIKIILIALVVMIVVMATVVLYAREQYNQILRQTEHTLSDNTKKVANSIDASIGYALNSIQVTAIALTNNMKGDKLDNPEESLAKYIENGPFDDIEYIRWDGMNYTNAGEAFDASDREYYIQGMKGESGVWVNYHPKYSKEPLLNFYTPLRYHGRTVGVITGTIGGNTTMRSGLLNEYYGQPVMGILVDEQNRIVSSTEQFETGMVLNAETAQVFDEYKQVFLEAIEKADSQSVNLGGKYEVSVCTVAKIGGNGWKVIQVAPSTSIHEIVSNINRSTNWAVGIIFVTAILFFIFVSLETKRISDYSIKQANEERDTQMAVLTSMAEVYYSMHLIDLKDYTYVEYSSKNQVKEASGKDKDAIKTMSDVMHVTMADEFLNFAMEFTDLTTLAERMKGKKFTYSELMGKNVGWIRLSFIAIEVDEEQKPTKVICTTQVIEEEKKREQNLLYKSNTDELTRFLNRRAYEEDIVECLKNPVGDDFVFISLDVNGLKVVNDTLGHIAGDDLLRGAAQCMRQCFGSYGKLYRIGGDEFVAMINAKEDRLSELKADFEDIVSEWKGTLVDSLSISKGYVSKKEFPDKSIDEITEIAEKRMYQEKEAYYKNKGVDRRGQRLAHTALCALYTKILKINLSEDSFQIVNVDDKEKTKEMGYVEKISEWFSSFGKSGQVHPEDLENYLKKTDLTFLADYFKNGKDSIRIVYRRKKEDDYSNVMMEMIPADDYSHENQNLFLYVKEIGASDFE